MARTIWDELAYVDRPILDLARALGAPLELRPHATAGRPFLPATDVYARNGDLVVRLDLPGLDVKKDISVTLEQGELVIRGERREDKEIDDSGYYRHESVRGVFERRIAVPEGTEESDVKAEYRGGVLEVTLPKAAKEATKPTAKPIPVKTIET